MVHNMYFQEAVTSGEMVVKEREMVIGEKEFLVFEAALECKISPLHLHFPIVVESLVFELVAEHRWFPLHRFMRL